MFCYILVFASFIACLILLTRVRAKLLTKSLLCFYYWVGVIVLVFIVNIVTNFAFFGNFLSPLEEQLYWIPILRAPLVEEGSKLIFIYVLKKRQKVSGNELIRLGGSIGNWFF